MTRRRTVASQLNLAFVAVFSIPLAALAFYFGWKFEDDLASRARAEASARLERTAETVGRKMEVLESVAATLSAYKALLDYTSSPGAPSAEDLLAVKELLVTLDRIRALNPDVVRTRLFLPNPDWPEVWPFLFKEDRVHGLNWYPAVRGGASRWKVGHWDELTFMVDTMSRKDLLVSLFKPVKDSYGSYLGSLQVAMTVEVFFDDLFDSNAPPTAALWVPGDGPPRDLWGRNLPPALVEAAGQVDQGPLGLTPPLADRRTVVWKRLPALGAVLLLQVPRPEAAAVLPFQWTLAAGTFLVLGLAALLFSFGSRRVLNRLEAVSQAVTRVSAGDWDAPVPVAGNDEVADLARSFQDLVQRLKTLVDRLVAEQVAAKDAELRALQSQINAHFLYNVLEAIRMTAFVEGQDQVADALAALGRTLRYGMEWDRPVVTLKEEMAHVEAYLVLWNLRFGGGIEWETDLDPGAEEARLTKFSLQPLVENAVVHGFGPRGKRGTVRLTARRGPEGLGVTLADDGVGAPEERWEALRDTLASGRTSAAGDRPSIGLSNVDHRLKETFGPGAGLRLVGTAGGWTRISFTLPPEETP